MKAPSSDTAAAAAAAAASASATAAAAATKPFAGGVRFDHRVHFAPSVSTADTGNLSPADVLDNAADAAASCRRTAVATPARPVRVLTKSELLVRIEAAAAAAAIGNVSNSSNFQQPPSSSSAAATTSLNMSKIGNLSNRSSFILDDSVPNLLPKYQPVTAVPPSVDMRGGRGGRVTENVREVSAAAVAAATDRPTSAKQQVLRRRMAVNERTRSKLSSLCAILVVFLLLILPITMVVGTATQIFAGCRIWLNSPILLLCIGLCSAVLAVTVPLFMFRLMGVHFLEDLISVCTITVINIVMCVIILALLMVVTGALIFHPINPTMRANCSEFIKKFVIVCVSVLWFLVGAILLTFCCDAIMY